MKKINKYLSIATIIISLLIFPLSLNGYIDVNAFIDYKICIDPGHGGWDNGAIYNDVYEDEINLNIASKLYEVCLDKNMMAYLIRSDDYDLASLYAENRKQEDLKRRAEIIDFIGCDIFVSIHVNSFSGQEVHGPMVYYEKNNDYSYELAKMIQKQLNLLTSNNKTVHADNFYLFNKCDVTGVLIECGFISNDSERNKLLDDSYQSSIAEAIYEGIYQFYLR